MEAKLMIIAAIGLVLIMSVFTKGCVEHRKMELSTIRDCVEKTNKPIECRVGFSQYY